MTPSQAQTGDAGTALSALEQRIEEIQALVRAPGLDRAPDPADSEGLAALCLTLADVLERTQRRLIESNIQLMSLREVSHHLLSVQTTEEAARMIALYLHKAFDYERVAVLLTDGDAPALSGWVAARDAEGSVTESVQLNVQRKKGVLADVFRRVEPRMVADPAADPPCAGKWTPAFDPARLNSFIAVPLKSAAHPGTSLGLIVTGRSNPNLPLASSDLVLLDSIGSTMATVVENARLYEEVKRSELFREDILNNLASGLVAIDLEGRAISMNETAARMTGFGATDVIGRRPPFLSENDKGIEAALRGSFAGTAVLRKETVITRSDGTVFPAGLSTSPLRNPEGKVYGAVATFLDLTDYKRMEERLAQLDRLAVLGRFTAGIAHEIRNPLTGISTGVQYLVKGMDDGPNRDNAAFIMSEIKRLDRIVEDLFRVTHPHALMTTPEDLKQLLERSLQSLGSLPADRGITVTTEFAAELPRVPLDADQLQQVAINLIKNAVEATPRGGSVTIRTGRRPGRRGEEGWATFSVADTGSGMTPEVRRKIFEPFFTSKKEGTGLGLYISHGIVERHGGHLRVETRQGPGSTFTVELPLEPYPGGGPS